METHGRATRWSARDLADVLLPPRTPSARPAQAGAVVERFVNALVDRNLDAMLACLTEDVYFVSGEDFGGHAGVREWFRLDSTDQPARELVDMVELDDSHVFVEVCTWRAGGSDTRGCVYTVHDGKIAAIELFANPEHAYRARDVVPG